MSHVGLKMCMNHKYRCMQYYTTSEAISKCRHFYNLAVFPQFNSNMYATFLQYTRLGLFFYFFLLSCTNVSLIKIASLQSIVLQVRVFIRGMKRPVHMLSSLEIYSRVCSAAFVSSSTLPPPSPPVTKYCICRECICVAGGGGGGVLSYWRPYSAGLLHCTYICYDIQNL